MSNLRQAAQQALEALEDYAKQYPHMQKGYMLDAVTALRAALAEPVQEPHDYRIRYDRPCYKCGNMYCPANCKDTAPPQRKPLTDEEMDACLRKAGVVATYEALRCVGRVVEAAHGIGEKK